MKLTRAEWRRNKPSTRWRFESWRRTAYLVLDGFGRGKHLHYDTNSITEFVQGGERWLLDHDYLTRNTTEHNMLSVVRDGRAAELVPSLAALDSLSDLPRLGYTRSTVKAYNGVDWERRIVWRKGGWLLVADSATARDAGQYDLELTWKTIDRGRQQVENGRDFVATRAFPTHSEGVSVVDDPDASGKRALVLGTPPAPCLPVDLPGGDYAVSIVGYGENGQRSSFVAVDGEKPVPFHIP